MTDILESNTESSPGDMGEAPTLAQELEDSAVPVEVHVRPKNTEAYDKLVADIAAEAPVAEAPASAAEHAVKLQAISPEDLQIPQKVLLAEVRDVTAGARSLDELKNNITPHMDEWGLAETADGWYQAIPGESGSAQLILAVLNQERTALEKRSTVERARQATSRAFDTIGEMRQVHQERKEERALQAENEAREQAEVVRQQVYQEQQQNREQLILDRARAKLDPIDDVINREQDAQTKPLFDKIIQARKNQLLAREQAERRGLSGEKRKEMDAKYAHQVGELHTQIEKLKKSIENKLREERKLFEDVSEAQIEALLYFEKSEQPDPHIFKPDKTLAPEYAAVIAGANSEAVGKIEPPHQVDEYKLGSSVMQRLVYRTADKQVVVVEDWDKTSGKLKRQSIIKGDDLLIPDYENSDVGRVRKAIRKRSKDTSEVLSNQAYKKLGPVITKAEVAADSGTSYQTGFGEYSRNLVRSGSGTLSGARELASHSYKPKNEKGFIALLQEEWAKSRAKK